MKTHPAYLLLFLTIGVLLVGCSSSAMQYLGYRINSGESEIEGDITILADNIPAPVSIILDEYAVPHLRSSDERALMFGLGYMHGRDRRFQMETLRLLSQGRMRELIGDQDHSGVMKNMEIFSRMLGLKQDADSIMNSCTGKDLEMFQAYADGVNLATVNEPKPLEFRLLNYEPTPWTPEDSAFITALISFGLNKNWEMELGRLELIVHQLRTGGSIDRAMNIWRPRRDLPPHLIGEAPAEDPFASIPPIAPELVEYLTAYTKTMRSSLEADKPVQVAETNDDFWQGFVNGGSRSNNWAVSSQWTGTGAGGFSSDPHMPHMMPPLGYLAHLKCDGCENGSYEVIGGCFMGLPAITFGTNGKVAWGPTSNWGDVTDLFVEKAVPGRADHYFYKGEQLPFTTRKEEFRIRNNDGSYQVEKKTVRCTRHGVLLNDFVERLPVDFPLVALSRSTAEGKPISALRAMYVAANVHEARIALNDFSAMVGHWSLADSSGNTAYCGPMKLPLRRHHLGTLPVPGWTGTYDWTEYVAIDQLPWIENHPQGFIGTCNNQVVQPESMGYPINFEGDIHHRYKRLVQILTAGRTDAPIADQLDAQQHDGVDMGFIETLPVFGPALLPLQEDPDPLIAKAARTMLAWDGDHRPDSTAATIYESLVAYLVKQTLEDEVSETTMTFLLNYFNAEPPVFDILTNPANPAWDDRHTEQTETAADVIAATFRVAVKTLAERYGEDIDKWQWQVAAPFYLEHPFGSDKSLAPYLNRGPFPTAGGGNTLFKNQFQRRELTQFAIKYGPVLRIIVDFSDLANSRMSVPGGQSGRPASPHYDDQIDFFMYGGGITMDMDFTRIEKKATGALLIRPQQ